MRLLLIRHADRIQPPSPVISGWNNCPGLTEEGFRQSRRLAERFQSTGEIDDCAVLLSSPLLRARQTAQAIAPVARVQKIEETTDLCEINPGAAEGLTEEAYQSQYGSFHLMAEPDRPFAPGGESWNQFLQRIRSFHERVAEQYEGKTVVAVSHAGFIWVSMLVMLAFQPVGTRAFLDPTYTGITEWQHRKGQWVLARYNDFAHRLDYNQRNVSQQ